jgi:hypothetical protein
MENFCYNCNNEVNKLLHKNCPNCSALIHHNFLYSILGLTTDNRLDYSLPFIKDYTPVENITKKGDFHISSLLLSKNKFNDIPVFIANKYDVLIVCNMKGCMSNYYNISFIVNTQEEVDLLSNKIIVILNNYFNS